MKRKKAPVATRLLDCLLGDVIIPPLPNRDVILDRDMIEAHNSTLKEQLRGSVCIEASNVCEFFKEAYTGGEDKFHNFWKDLKCLVPPFDKFFIEWNNPLFSHAKRIGMLFMACLAHEAEDKVRELLGSAAKDSPRKVNDFIAKHDPKWIYVTMDFLEFEQGRHLSGLRGPYHIGSYKELWMSHASLHSISHEESMQIGAASLVGWTALAMLNCNNIERVRHDPVQRRTLQRQNKGLVSYHTIRVNAAKTPPSIAAAPLPTGITQRLHQIRGHMKDYRNGKGLFGKYKGLWFWGAHLAGSGSEGVVVSDYSVKTND